MTPARLFFLILLIFAVLFILRYPINYLRHGGFLPADFAVYYGAWHRYLGGINPYNASDPSPFKYSPGFLVLFGLLPLPHPAAWAVFSTVITLIFIAALWISTPKNTWADVLKLVAGFMFSWKGIIETMDYGQMELVIFALAMTSAALLLRFPFFSGLLAGTLPWMKLPWAFLIVPLLLWALVIGFHETKRKGKRIKRIISGYITSCIFWGAALPSLVFGPDKAKALSQDWVSIMRVQPKSLFFVDLNQSLWMYFLRWFKDSTTLGLGLAALVAASLLGIVTIGTVVKGLRSKDLKPAQWLTSWLIVTQLLNPLSWRWGSAFLLTAPFSDGVVAKKAKRLLWVLVFTLWLIQQNPIASALGFHHWTTLHSAGIITIYWIVFLILSA